MGSQSHPPRPHVIGQEREAREKPKAQDKQRNDTDQGHKVQMGEAGFPGKTLAGNICETTARPCRPIAAPAQRPTHQLKQVPMWQYVDTNPTSQEPAWWHADLREDPPLRHLSCLPTYMASQASLARARVDTRRSGDGRDRFLPRPR